MNLRLRFFIITAALILLAGLAAWVPVRQLAENLIEQWAVRYAEKQVLYDKVRTLQPIIREITLSRQFAKSPQILDWARNPDDPELTRRAIAEMESFRLNFYDQSYFVALLKSGRYYHNNADNEFAGKQYRYDLTPGKAADSWFYEILEQEREMHLNVNLDEPLGVTKLWIDVLLRDENEVLGMVGTGLDLTTFIEKVVTRVDPGITSLFVDHQGAIQIYRDQSMIDFSSIDRPDQAHKSLELLFDRPQDEVLIRNAMKQLESSDETRVISHFVSVSGKRYLASVAYLQEVDWYHITLMDLEVLLPLSSFGGIIAIYIMTLLVALLLFNMALERYVLRPLERLEKAMQQVSAGGFNENELPTNATGEVARLIKHFGVMAGSVMNARSELEDKVRERTEALDKLTKIDPLTELLNRRGMTERLESEVSRVEREKGAFGVIWLDLDLFKEVNDQYGHRAGDEALKEVARCITVIMRAYDCAARWGGDEFLVLIEKCDEELLAAVAERLRRKIARSCRVLDDDGEVVKIRISAGGYVVNDGDSLDTVLQRADEALYAAKDAGRNCFRSFTDLKSLPTEPAD